ncbi:hypothetical protein MPH_05921 [Macrophomina phaseolina MS6]|uniref:Uncharacterized protein n=1 Tax=Macrophomina phaseolina (strain MS6) TaxID=1126212 RepID=K2SJE9_MACPH|nr:hypothetical protein MPH_05921 [Macrophomina phaseolina MS6]
MAKRQLSSSPNTLTPRRCACRHSLAPTRLLNKLSQALPHKPTTMRFSAVLALLALGAAAAPLRPIEQGADVIPVEGDDNSMHTLWARNVINDWDRYTQPPADAERPSSWEEIREGLKYFFTLEWIFQKDPSAND